MKCTQRRIYCFLGSNSVKSGSFFVFFSCISPTILNVQYGIARGVGFVIPSPFLWCGVFLPVEYKGYLNPRVTRVGSSKEKVPPIDLSLYAKYVCSTQSVEIRYRPPLIGALCFASLVMPLTVVANFPEIGVLVIPSLHHSVFPGASLDPQ